MKAARASGSWLLVLYMCWAGLPGIAQVGPQGQQGKWVTWSALQLDQPLDSSWTWSTVIAYSRRSDLAPSAPFSAFGVFCLRQEFSTRLHPRVRLSLGAFYSSIGTHGFEDPHPAYENEIRVYPRVYYDLVRAKWRLSAQLRLDMRHFSAPGFIPLPEPLEVRTRLS
ncbi:MAG: DUF2490 domain-containing protein, partial [Bacteroidetes bacterium]|nr:DUF2490 domain-containing protein [Bacteroidota bacterium]